MISIAHLLDDFGMGGVTRALTLFDQPTLKRLAQSNVVPMKPSAKVAPKLDADLIVDHMSFSWARLPFLVSLRARNPGARIVHVEHSYTRGFEANTVTSKGRFRTMIQLCALFFDDVICVSEAQRDWMAGEVGVSPTKLRVIYPWTDRESLFVIPPARQADAQPVQLLAYGRFAEVKNFASLISAMRYFSPGEVCLTLFGDGPQRGLLQALAADLPNVDVFGPVDDPASFLELCDAVIVPSHYEAFGLVATEARMAARALIVADVDGLPEQAQIGGRIAPMRTAEDIANSIRWAIGADLPKLGVAGRRNVQGQHEQILRQWTHLICSTRWATQTTTSQGPQRALGRAMV
ncbi:glycosyltransferase [Erythrobacter sp. NAP1]|uniref:glycosyltransferase family 4 protein n=1 Tax=Erythrobacter sp. NAP1 TaxID=237727 RepID=UPI0000686C0E|nr:glycosyltransferase family 4 protein [Erythrobacter sp. NAP1]EAQ29591.1 glycosyltransferase [Erythrobacter sp. NAP1]